jgi:hypothetical protein
MIQPMIETLGHTVQLIPAQHVKPSTLDIETDANGSIAIIKASLRLNLRFVTIKTTHQQGILRFRHSRGLHLLGYANMS